MQVLMNRGYHNHYTGRCLRASFTTAMSARYTLYDPEAKWLCSCCRLLDEWKFASRYLQVPAATRQHAELVSKAASIRNSSGFATRYGLTVCTWHAVTVSQGQQNVLYGTSTFVMHERCSRYDPLSSCLVDFKSRASMASTKNFQLVKSGPASQRC
jgi:hypothetical protein